MVGLLCRHYFDVVFLKLAFADCRHVNNECKIYALIFPITDTLTKRPIDAVRHWYKN